MSRTQTIIDSIQTRHERDEQEDYVCRGESECTWNRTAWRKYKIHKDRATLLSILAEIGALPTHAFLTRCCVDFNQLQTILNRTNQQDDS